MFRGVNAINAIPWQDLPLTRAVRSELVGWAEPKGGRPEEWFGVEDDVRCACLPLEIEMPSGWRKKSHDGLKRQYEDMKTLDGSDGLFVALPPHGCLRIRTLTQWKANR